jgi:hypothetical protein
MKLEILIIIRVVSIQNMMNIKINQKLQKKKSSKLNLKKVPKRLIEVLGLNESSEICSMCRNKTDKDSEYLQNEKYKIPIPIKKNNLNNNDNLQII